MVNVVKLRIDRVLFLLLLVSVGFSGFAFDQWGRVNAQVLIDADSVRIDSIAIVGALKTKHKVILRELEVSPGQIVSRNELEAAHSRIENLKIFNRVIFRFREGNPQNILEVDVWERWFLFPVPIFIVNEHDWKKLSYGLGLFHSNFRGMAENLWFSGWLGYNPGVDVTYINPWFGGKHRYYLKLQLQIQKIKTKTLLFPEQNVYQRNLMLELGKRWGPYWYFDVVPSLQLVNGDGALLWNSEHKQDRVLGFGAKLQQDNRNLREYSRNGRLFSLLLSRYVLLNGGKTFNRLQIDWREFKSIAGITFAGRLFAELSWNPLAVYHHLYLGYEERIRGEFSEVREGANRMLTSLEVRLPMMRERYLQLGEQLDLPGYMQQLKFGLYLTLFHDAGAVWNSGDRLAARHWLSGTGVGLNFLLPYSNVLRLEYAWNDRGRGEYIVDVNASF